VVAITPEGKHAYVTNYGDTTVSVITTATGAVSAPITVGKIPTGVAICPARSAHRR
jgi:YVTN family beta-propeller protein